MNRYLLAAGVCIWLAGGAWAVYAWLTPTPKVPVIVYLVDTLRADRLGTYGYARPTSPNIDAIAAESVVFENAYAAAPWTLPSMASLFTSKYLCEHEVVTTWNSLNPAVPTLAQVLQEAGFYTASAFNNVHVGREFGLDHGFVMLDEYDSTFNERREVAAATIDVAGDQPFFLYLHTMEPHETLAIRDGDPLPIDKYLRPFGSVNSDKRREMLELKGKYHVYSMFDWVQNKPRGTEPGTAQRQDEILEKFFADLDDWNNLYDASVRQADENFGNIVGLLRERGIWDRAIVVFTSDHGEEMGEHGGWLHAQSVYEEVAHVPLMIHFPGGEHAGTRIKTPVSIIDIMPTILDFEGLPGACAECRGISLLDLVRRGDTPGAADQRIIRIYRDDQVTHYAPLAETRGYLNVGLRRNDWKGILSLDTKQVQLFDLGTDPGEKSNRAAEEGQVSQQLFGPALREWQECARNVRYPAAESNLGEDTREKLNALGYLN